MLLGNLWHCFLSAHLTCLDHVNINMIYMYLYVFPMSHLYIIYKSLHIQILLLFFFFFMFHEIKVLNTYMDLHLLALASCLIQLCLISPQPNFNSLYFSWLLYTAVKIAWQGRN